MSAMNSCVPDYLIQGNGTVYTIDSCYKNGGPQLGRSEEGFREKGEEDKVGRGTTVTG